jgi:hypothetical protein
MDFTQREYDLLRYAVWLYGSQTIERCIDLKARNDPAGRQEWDLFNDLNTLRERLDAAQGAELQAFVSNVEVT